MFGVIENQVEAMKEEQRIALIKKSSLKVLDEAMMSALSFRLASVKTFMETAKDEISRYRPDIKLERFEDFSEQLFKLMDKSLFY
jgi:hypothetical protein